MSHRIGKRVDKGILGSWFLSPDKRVILIVVSMDSLPNVGAGGGSLILVLEIETSVNKLSRVQKKVWVRRKGK
jgi:hypothetical protein